MTAEERRLDKEDMDILDDLYKAYDEGYKQGRADGYNQALEDMKKELIKIYHKRYMHDIYLDDIDDIVERLHK